jgi:hypothetical protein
MSWRIAVPFGFALAVSLLSAACGGSPVAPPPPPPGPGPAPINALPSIDSITVQGRRNRQPAGFADVRETVDVTAAVRDAETPIDELIYQWTATAGTFSGTGRTVTWTAPDTAATPTPQSPSTATIVTITLKVVEAYGHPGQAKSFSHEATGTQTIALHDSILEVGEMSRQFLIDFSTTSIKDSQVVMRNFNRSVCPRPSEVDDEREQVESHYTNYVMNHYEIASAAVAVNFGGVCAVPGGALPGDACASVRVRWDSTGPEGRAVTTGVDLLTSVYSVADRRWWLCSSRFQHDTTFGHAFYAR